MQSERNMDTGISPTLNPINDKCCCLLSLIAEHMNSLASQHKYWAESKLEGMGVGGK